MPVYIYGCNKCDGFFEKQMTIDNRRLPLENPCPDCNMEGTLEILPAAPSIGDPIKLGIVKKPDWWIERLARIKEKHVGSTIKLDKTFT